VPAVIVYGGLLTVKRWQPGREMGAKRRVTDDRNGRPGLRLPSKTVYFLAKWPMTPATKRIATSVLYLLPTSYILLKTLSKSRILCFLHLCPSIQHTVTMKCVIGETGHSFYPKNWSRCDVVVCKSICPNYEHVFLKYFMLWDFTCVGCCKKKTFSALHLKTISSSISALCSSI